MSRPYDLVSEQFTQMLNVQPYDVHGVCNRETDHNRRYLYQVLYSVFDLGLPKEWRRGGYVRFWTFTAGSYAVMYTNEFGWVPMLIFRLSIVLWSSAGLSVESCDKSLMPAAVGTHFLMKPTR